MFWGAAAAASAASSSAGLEKTSLAAGDVRVLDARSGAGLATADDLWLVGETGGTVRAFAPDTGEPLWEVHCKAPLGAGVAIGGAKAYVGTTTGDLCILDLDDGTWWDSVPLGAPVVSTPLVTPTAVVVALGDARLVQLTR